MIYHSYAEMREEYPKLHQFLGCYLHQDYLEEYSSAMAAVQGFLAEHSHLPETVRAVVREISEVLVDERFAESPGDVLLSLGCNYLPTCDGITEADWLKQVLAVLEETS